MTTFVKMERPESGGGYIEIYVNPALVRFVESHELNGALCWLHFDRDGESEFDRHGIVCVRGNIHAVMARLRGPLDEREK